MAQFLSELEQQNQQIQLRSAKKNRKRSLQTDLCKTAIMHA